MKYLRHISSVSSATSDFKEYNFSHLDLFEIKNRESICESIVESDFIIARAITAGK